MVKVHDCIQTDKLNSIQNNSDTMANDIKSILDTLKLQGETLKNIEQFMALAPYKYADKEKTEKFQNGINLKIASVSSASAVIFAIITFAINKLL